MATLMEIRSAMADELAAIGVDPYRIAESIADFRLPESDVAWAQVVWINGEYVDALLYGATAVRRHRGVHNS